MTESATSCVSKSACGVMPWEMPHKGIMTTGEKPHSSMIYTEKEPSLWATP